MLKSFYSERQDPSCFLLYKKAIVLSGADCVQYLHSQTTNNIISLELNGFHFNSILDLSGKLISGFLVLKKSNEELYLLTEEDQIDQTLERIEKYHIAEDFEVSVIDINSYLLTHSDENQGFIGQYFFEEDHIVLTKNDKECDSKETFNLLSVLMGTPRLGHDTEVGELVNNTRYDELAVDYSKGCYPGQETVSKINTRRGAAFKPVLLELDCVVSCNNKDKISFEGKKIGEVLSIALSENKTYIKAKLTRSHRVNHSHIEIEINDKLYSALVLYYPYFAVSKKDQAREIYDIAVEHFYNNENDKAVELFLKAIKIDPLFEDAYESLGVLYGRLEQYDLAIKMMEQLKDLNSKCMMAYTNLSLYHMKVGEIEKAEDYKSQATLLNFELLGDEAQRKKKAEEAEQRRIQDMERRESMFKQVIEMDAEDAMANNGMGEIELDRKNYDAAVSYFSTAITGDAKYSVAYLGKSKSLYQLNKLEECKQTLIKGIEVATKNGDLMPANEMQSLLNRLS